MKKSIVVCLISVASISNFALAQSALPIAPVASDPVFSLKDSSLSLRHRYQESTTGETTYDQAQYYVDLNMQFRLDEQGHWHLVSRIKSGPTFNTGWNNVGIGNGTQFDEKLRARELFLKYESNGNVVSVGALSDLPNASVKGAFSFDDDGWIDGARYETSNLHSWAKRLSVTIGRIDDVTTPSLLARKIGAPNVIQVHVQGVIGPRVNYVVEGTQFDSTNGPSEQYLRTMFEVATKDVLKIIDSVVVENLMQNSSKPLQGFALSTKTALTSTWSLSTVYTHKGHELSRDENIYAPREDFYREGDQISAIVTKKLKLQLPTELSVGAGKTVSSANGFRIDSKLKIKF